jgi:hypothetical protein
VILFFHGVWGGYLDQPGGVFSPDFRTDIKIDSQAQHHQRNNRIEKNDSFVHVNTFLSHKIC